MPQDEVAALTGYTGRYSADPSKRTAAYGCGISDDAQSIVLTRYERSAERENIDTWMRNGEQGGRDKLPRELGIGAMDDYEVRGYPFRSIGAWFRCGEENSLITIYVKKNPARDQDHDLVQLMRIAQRRFAEMFGCELGGAPPGT